MSCYRQCHETFCYTTMQFSLRHPKNSEFMRNWLPSLKNEAYFKKHKTDRKKRQEGHKYLNRKREDKKRTVEHNTVEGTVIVQTLYPSHAWKAFSNASFIPSLLSKQDLVSPLMRVFTFLYHLKTAAALLEMANNDLKKWL